MRSPFLDPISSRRFGASKRMPSGLTRLELLLVLCVIALNVILFLPLVEQSREVARKGQCKQNLKQVGLALHNYLDTFGCFPSGFEVNHNGNYQGWGWSLRILPSLDAASVYHQIEAHFSDGFQGLPDTAELKQRIPSLWCPSDRAGPTVPHALVCTSPVIEWTVTPGTVDWQNRLGHSSYFGNAGYLQLEFGGIQYNSALLPTSIEPLTNAGSLGHFSSKSDASHRYCDQAAFGGAFGQNSAIKPFDVKDGTSNCLMLGERYSPVDCSANSVGHGTWLGVPDCTTAQGLAMVLADASVRMNVGMPLREQTTGFGSLHHQGATFAICDGSVRFISERVNPVLFRNLSVIDDAQR